MACTDVRVRRLLEAKFQACPEHGQYSEQLIDADGAGVTLNLRYPYLSNSEPFSQLGLGQTYASPQRPKMLSELGTDSYRVMFRDCVAHRRFIALRL